MLENVVNIIIWNAVVAASLAVMLKALSFLSILRDRPAVMHCLWGLVLLKLVTPPIVAVPVPDASRSGYFEMESESGLSEQRIAAVSLNGGQSALTRPQFTPGALAQAVEPGTSSGESAPGSHGTRERHVAADVTTMAQATSATSATSAGLLLLSLCVSVALVLRNVRRIRQLTSLLERGD